MLHFGNIILLHYAVSNYFFNKSLYNDTIDEQKSKFVKRLCFICESLLVGSAISHDAFNAS